MAEHPSQDELSGFLLGKLAPDATEAVAEHIDHCPPCQDTMHKLEADNDTLVSSLRQPAPSSIGDAKVDDVVEKVAAITPPAKEQIQAAEPSIVVSPSVMAQSGAPVP